MSDDADVGTGLVVTEDEQMNEEKRDSEKGSLLERQMTVIVTDGEMIRVATPAKERGKEESVLSELSSSPLGSYQSIQSSQSSEGDKMIPYVAPLKEMRVLWFEDTLSEEDHRKFNVIYESLLLEGKARNLTDLTMGMVLAGKPHTWLQVMHERLKHLLISLETFQKKKNRADCSSQGRSN